MSKQFFFFTRKVTVKKVDDKGNPIPVTISVEKEVDGVKTQVEEPIPGQFVTEEKLVTDSFNLQKVVRTHTLEDERVVALLDDGHEETQKNPTLKNPNKRGPITKADIIEEKTRVWVQSEIVILKEEAEEFYEALAQVTT